MKKHLKTLLISLFTCVVIFGFVSESFAAVTLKVYFRRYQVGTTESMDNIPYDDLMAVGINTSLCIVGTDANSLIFYTFNKTSTDTEDSPLYDTVSANDQSGAGRWKKMTGLELGRTATQASAYRDSDCTDSDVNVYEYINCIITTTNAEECGKYTQVQTGGVLTTIKRDFAPETESYSANANLDITARMVLLEGTDNSVNEILDLQNGDFPDQEVHLVANAGIDANDTCTIAMTDTTCTNCPAIVFDFIGENAVLRWTGTTWILISLMDDYS